MQYYISEWSDPAMNLALEELLFSKIEEEFVLFYVNSPSVIIGCNQVLQNEVNEPFCQEKGIGIFRRMTGGGTVFHDDGNLNYSFIVNKKSPLSGMGGNFLAPVISALQQMNIEAYQGSRKEILVTGDYKVSGTASHLKGMREIHHGTLLFNSELDVLKTAISSVDKNPLLKGVASVPSKVINLQEILSENDADEMSFPVFQQVFISNCIRNVNATEAFMPDEDLRAAIEFLAGAKYHSSSWNYRK